MRTVFWRSILCARSFPGPDPVRESWELLGPRSYAWVLGDIMLPLERCRTVSGGITLSSVSL